MRDWQLALHPRAWPEVLSSPEEPQDSAFAFLSSPPAVLDAIAVPAAFSRRQVESVVVCSWQ